MIISHKYRFIFLKTAKTAGTSIEIALSRHLGKDDVVTPISAADEKVRGRQGFRGPQNFRVPLRQHNLRELAAAAIGRRKRFYNHIPGVEVRNLIGDDIWNSYFKFCFDRNPFDRVISLYYWCHKAEPRPTLTEFLESPQISLLTTRGLSLYTDDQGEIIVNQVGRYESLAQDLESIRRAIGIPEPLQLPHTKSSHREDRRHYSEVIDPHSRMRIESLFNREMKLHNYEF
jgi:hypothetical protein